MSVLKRTTTWEISESEDDSGAETKPNIQCDDQSNETIAANTDICKDESRPTEREYKPLPSPLAKSEPSRDTLVPPPRRTKSGVPSPVRKRRTKEGVEANRLRAEDNNEAREKRKMAKAREKEEKKQEQQRRREEAEYTKSLRPENYLKCLTVCIDPAVLQQDGSDVLLGTLSAFEWKFNIESQQIPHSIAWTTELPQRGETSRRAVEEDQVVLVLDLNDFMDMVICVRNTLENAGEETGVQSFLRPWLGCLNRDTKKVVTVLVTGAHPNNWPVVETLQSQMGMEDLEIEEVLVYLQLYYRNLSVVFLNGWQEVTDHVVTVTKALSKRPFKLMAEQAELPFCVDGSWASGARVEKDGSGLIQVWSKQVQQLNRVSPAVASSVTAAYPSPQLLLQAYQRMETEEERKGLLADLRVTTGGKERRVGPDISNRLYRCLTAQNPQLVLD